MSQSSQLYENLRQLITVVDELRDIGLHRYVQLPRIVVIGTQSAGKSSVLESIVGMDFLPRGDGVVTRRPLELRLIHLGKSESPAYGKFEKNDKHFFDFVEVREEIERLTDERCGTNANIVDDPIVLTVYSPNCPDLTLIDLPGITRVPMAGTDQTDDIEQITKEMAMRYIKDARTIILAVMPANSDMTTSDALQLARKADMQGHRTIGVLTKIDIMDAGTDASRMLRGDVINLKLGFVGIRNRSQHDIMSGKSVVDAINDETQYFQTHPVYSRLPPNYLGTRVLIDKLTKVLFRQIREFLPEIKREISDKTKDVQLQLTNMGEGVPESSHEKAQLMWSLINDFVSMFTNSIRGRYDPRLSVNLGENVSGGHQIRQIFNEFLLEFEDSEVTAKMTDEEIDQAIKSHEGDSLPGFPSGDTFESLVKPHLHELSVPSQTCLQAIHNTLELLAQRIARLVFRRFPALQNTVLELTGQLLQHERDQARVVIENLIACETEYLFTNDVNYLSDHGTMEKVTANEPSPPSQNQAPSHIQQSGQFIQDTASSLKQSAANVWQVTQSRFQQPQSQEERKRQMMSRYNSPFVQEIRRRIETYFKLVLRHVRDHVPKTVGFFLIRKAQGNLQYKLYSELNKTEKMEEFLGEPPHILEERRSLKSQLEVLKNAHLVLQRDPMINAINLDLCEQDSGRVAVKRFTKHEPVFSQPKLSPSDPPKRPGNYNVSKPFFANDETNLFEKNNDPRSLNRLFD